MAAIAFLKNAHTGMCGRIPGSGRVQFVNGESHRMKQMNTDKTTGFLICVHLCHSVAHSAFAKALRRDLSAFATARRCGKSHLVKAGQTLLFVPFALGSPKLASDRLWFAVKTKSNWSKNGLLTSINSYYRLLTAQRGDGLVGSARPRSPAWSWPARLRCASVAARLWRDKTSRPVKLVKPRCRVGLRPRFVL
jgi:hypothetical protein